MLARIAGGRTPPRRIHVADVPLAPHGGFVRVHEVTYLEWTYHRDTALDGAKPPNSAVPPTSSDGKIPPNDPPRGFRNILSPDVWNRLKRRPFDSRPDN
jgi:hypothetical protein